MRQAWGRALILSLACLPPLCEAAIDGAFQFRCREASTATVVPAPRGALTSVDVPLLHATRKMGSWAVTSLMRSGTVVDGALAAVARDEKTSDVTFFLWDVACNGTSGERREGIAIVEQLYAVALGHDATAVFKLARCRHPDGCSAEEASPLSHSELLRLISAERNRLVAAAGMRSRVWRDVTLYPLARPEPDVCAVVSSAGGRRLEAGMVVFARAPHSVCTAGITSAGGATCTLEDAHGDHHEEDSTAEPVVATFSGSVLADEVLLPTTQVMRCDGAVLQKRMR